MVHPAGDTEPRLAKVEHRSLWAQAKALAALDGDSRDAELAVLSDFQGAMSAHFYAEEEAHGLLDHIRDRCPHRWDICDRLKAEHVVLRSKLSDILTRLEDGLALGHLRKDIRKFAEEICCHEDDEQQLLREVEQRGGNIGD